MQNTSYHILSTVEPIRRITKQLQPKLKKYQNLKEIFSTPLLLAFKSHWTRHQKETPSWATPHWSTNTKKNIILPKQQMQNILTYLCQYHKHHPTAKLSESMEPTCLPNWYILSNVPNATVEATRVKLNNMLQNKTGKR